MAFQWTCPYCGRDTTIVDENFDSQVFKMHKPNRDGVLHLIIEFVTCPNKECKNYTITSELYKAAQSNVGYIREEAPIHTWQMKPQSFAKQFPDYIPAPIVEDYEEACAIINLSAKASATLSRRCLQGIIRDFWGIRKNTLFQEINELNELCTNSPQKVAPAQKVRGLHKKYQSYAFESFLGE